MPDIRASLGAFSIECSGGAYRFMEPHWARSLDERVRSACRYCLGAEAPGSLGFLSARHPSPVQARRANGQATSLKKVQKGADAQARCRVDLERFSGGLNRGSPIGRAVRESTLSTGRDTCFVNIVGPHRTQRPPFRNEPYRETRW